MRDWVGSGGLKEVGVIKENGGIMRRKGVDTWLPQMMEINPE